MNINFACYLSLPSPPRTGDAEDAAIDNRRVCVCAFLYENRERGNLG